MPHPQLPIVDPAEEAMIRAVHVNREAGIERPPELSAEEAEREISRALIESVMVEVPA